MLGVALLYRRKREEGVWTPPIDFIGVANAANRCWVSATAGTHSFTAELPFAAEIPAGAGAGVEPATALFQTWTDKPHPILGTGALLLLKLPGEFDARTANFLNVADTLAPDCHQLGAWCHRDDWGLAFVTFLPALVFQRGGHYATNLFESLVWHSASRALWAHTLLTALEHLYQCPEFSTFVARQDARGFATTVNAMPLRRFTGKGRCSRSRRRAAPIAAAAVDCDAMATSDYTVENKGTLLLLRSTNAKAYEWLVAHTDPEAHWFGRALVVEHGYIADFVAQLRVDGFTVDETASLSGTP